MFGFFVFWYLGFYGDIMVGWIVFLGGTLLLGHSLIEQMVGIDSLYYLTLHGHE